MPYVTPDDRKWIDPIIDKLVEELRNGIVTKGCMNYIVTRLMLAFVGTDPRYADYSDAVAVVECVKLELYRRHVAPYEDVQREKNGDVN